MPRLVALVFVLIVACAQSESGRTDGDDGGGADSDTDADTDTDTDTDTGTGADTDTDADTDTVSDTGSDTGTDTATATESDSGSDTSDWCTAGEVFINELHYDNTGTDVGEAVEIAGPAGTDLSGWSIVLYNGNDGLAYSTTPLSATLENQGAGMGTVAVFYPTDGIQNGAPDGVALVDDENDAVQFLSYEGSFAALDGPANGLTSIDIGVEEDVDTAVGDSLQLTGVGCAYSDFSWTASSDSFGEVNGLQGFGF